MHDSVSWLLLRRPSIFGPAQAYTVKNSPVVLVQTTLTGSLDAHHGKVFVLWVPMPTIVWQEGRATPASMTCWAALHSG